MNWVTRDGDVKVVLGKLTKFEFDGSSGILHVQAKDGTYHWARVKNRTDATFALLAWFGRRNPRLKRFLADPTRPYNELKKTRSVRILYNNDLFAVTSPNYHPFNISDIERELRRELPEMESYDVVPPTGTHGGKFTAREGKMAHGIAYLTVDAGLKDAKHAASVYGEIVFLGKYKGARATLKPSKLIGELPGMELRPSKHWHIRTQAIRIVEEAVKMRNLLLLFPDLTAHAKAIDMSKREADTILQFYGAQERLSDRTLEIVHREYKRTQDKSLWQFVGAIAYASAREDVPASARPKLQKMAGELLMIAGSFDNYYQIVRGSVRRNSRIRVGTRD